MEDSPIRELRRRAKEVGVDADSVERAIEDAADPKKTIVELITKAEAAKNEHRRSQLTALTVSQLKAAARQAGLEMRTVDEAIEQAIDQAHDPKSAVVKLMFAAEARRGTAHAERGSDSSELPVGFEPEAEPEPEPAPEPDRQPDSTAVVVTDQRGKVLPDVAAFLKVAKLDKPEDDYLNLLMSKGVDEVEFIL